MQRILYVVANRFTLPITSLVLLIVVAHWSSALLGAYALVMAFYFVMQTLPLLGLTPYVMREVVHAPDRAGSYFTTVGTLAVLACVPIKLVTDLVTRWMAYPDDTRQAIALVGVLIVPGILAFLAELILISLDRPKPVAATAVVENVGRVAASVLVLRAGGGIVGLMEVLFAGRMLAMLWYCAVLAGLCRGRPAVPVIDRTILMGIWRVLPAFLTSGAIFVLVSRLPFIVMAGYATLEQVGYFGISYRGYEISTLLSSAVLTALYPDLARHAAPPAAQLTAYVGAMLRTLVATVVPGVALGVALAPLYVQILFPHQYPFPVPLTRLFVLLLLLGVPDQFLSQVLSCTGRQRDDAVASVAASIAAVASLWLLVPRLGAAGAAFGVAVTLAVQFGLRLYFVRRGLGPLVPARRLVPLLGTGACLLAAVGALSVAVPALAMAAAPVLCAAALALAPALRPDWLPAGGRPGPGKAPGLAGFVSRWRAGRVE